MYCPGRSWINDNENVDQLAAKPNQLGNIKMDRQDTYQSFKQQVEDSAQKTFLKSTYYARPKWLPRNRKKVRQIPSMC